MGQPGAGPCGRSAGSLREEQPADSDKCPSGKESPVWWCRTVSPLCRRLKQEDLKFKDTLGNIGRYGLPPGSLSEDPDLVLSIHTACSSLNPSSRGS